MARAPAPFRQSDITRAVRGVTAAGCEVARVTIATDGTINVITGKVQNQAATVNEWDDVEP